MQFLGYAVDIKDDLKDLVSKLPTAVKTFAERYFVVGMGGHGVAAFLDVPIAEYQTPGGQVRVPLIVLCPKAFLAGIETTLHVFAHELAHAWLDTVLPQTEDERISVEARVDALATEWGYPEPNPESGAEQ